MKKRRNCLLTFGKKNQYKFDSDKATEFEKADHLRYQLGQLSYLHTTKCEYKGTELLEHIDNTLINYGNIVDRRSGVNNYAEPILSLAQNRENDSKNWKCNLNVDDIFDNYIKPKITTKVEDIKEKDYEDLARILSSTKQFNLEDFISPQETQQPNTPQVEPQKPSHSFFNPSKFTKEPQNQTSTFPPSSRFNREQETRNPKNYHSSPRFPEESHPPRPQPSVPKKKYPWERQNQETRQDQDQPNNPFKTATRQFSINQSKKNNQRRGNSYHPAQNLPSRRSEESSDSSSVNLNCYGLSRRSLGNRKGVNSKFVPPVRRDDEDDMSFDGRPSTSAGGNNNTNNQEESPFAELLLDERLKSIEPKMVELIMNEIMDNGASVAWNDIAGLETAKTTIQEIVVWPMLRPDIFTGLRGPPKGILLFGPPGTGKTMIGKCIASQSKSTFFSISASSLTSKWIGEGEKMVRALFAVARCHQPAVIFIDEIDSLLSQRSESEHESSRRIKTEFLVQLDGATTASEDRLLVVGATNRPQELDEAARRRLVKRLYIPLPECKARQQLIKNLMNTQKHSLNQNEIEEICVLTDGYSGADMANLCREAALGPIRSLNFDNIQFISADEVREINFGDFQSALKSIRASVSSEDLNLYVEWNNKFGVYGR